MPELDLLFDASPEKLSVPEGPWVLCGAGPLGLRTLARCRDRGLRVLCWSDRRAASITELEGLPVLSHAEAVSRYNTLATFVVSTYHTAALWRGLKALGARRVLSYRALYAAMPEVFLPFMHMEGREALSPRRAEITEALSLFAEPSSREEFIRQVKARMVLDSQTLPDEIPLSQRASEYFPEGLYTRRDDEVFVDGGAFQGDTLQRFMASWQNFRKAYAFEPDPLNVMALEAWHKALGPELGERIEVRCAALGAREDTGRFESLGTVSSRRASEGGIEVAVSTLDSLMGPRAPTLIKLDLEGAEPEALAGGVGVMRDHSPVMAVTVYHRAEHLWTLPMALKRAQPEYRLYLRAHAEAGWDASVYAVPPGREGCLVRRSGGTA